MRFERQALPFLDRLYAAATQMASDRADADVLVQRTYLQAFEVFGSLPVGTSPKAWLFRTLAGTALAARSERSRSWNRVFHGRKITTCDR